MSTTVELARFAAETQWEDLSGEVRAHAKRCLVNAVAVAVHASARAEAAPLLDALASEGGAPRATVWGTGARTSLQQAALANGWLCHLDDYDDTHFPTVIHPSAPTIPAAFVAAELVGASGRDFLLAAALGIEVCCRIGVAIHPSHYGMGWHITGTCGVFGAAAAAGRVLGLSAEAMTHAMGTAGTQASGLRETFGSMAKAMNAGHPAQVGAFAALLARGGFTGPATVLEGRRGFGEVMAPASDWFRAVDGLGQRWEILNVGLKPYPCGVVAHPIIDAAIALRETGVAPHEIRRIDALVHPLVLELVDRPDPKDGLGAKFSYQHGAAVGFVDGAAFPEQYTDARTADPVIASLRSKVQAQVSPDFEQDAARLTLTTMDGRTFVHEVEHASGSPENPMSDERLDAKFAALTAGPLGEARSQRLLAALRGIDEADGVGESAALLSPS